MSTERRPVRSRRTVLRAGALTGLGLAGAQAVAPSRATAATTAATPDARNAGFLVGRGIADAGEVAEVGMMGYGRFDQQAAGLHTRLRARASSWPTRRAGGGSC